MGKTIVWLRRDLRLHDNRALNWACQNSQSLLAVYIHAPDEEQPWAPGGASRWWLHHSLQQLEQQLAQHGHTLHYFSGSSEDILQQLVQQTGADSLVFNRLYEPQLDKRDRALTQKLQQQVNVQSFDAGLFFKPGSLLNNQQQPYKVFTPFYKKCRTLLDEARFPHGGPLDKAALKKLQPFTVKSACTLQQLALLDSHPWHDKLHNYWQPGEQGASLALDLFIDEAAHRYEQNRDIPGVDATSKISAALHFGELSPQQVYASLQPLLQGVFNSADMAPAELFLKQLLWREFGHHILWHFPHTSSQSMNPKFKKSFWKNNARQLKAWQKGETGVPIVDAGMKQLWETGWMHNRVRMIVASFLTKNLGVHWLEGARWFWDTLVDADLANNSMGWQWVAGCGVDAAPYYRIFNPLTQAERFDKNNQYIERWLPQASGPGYPAPIVDIKASREAALDRYKQQASS